MINYSDLVKNQIVSQQFVTRLELDNTKPDDLLLAKSRVVQLFELKALSIIQTKAEYSKLFDVWFSANNWRDFVKNSQPLNTQLAEEIIQAWQRLEFVLLEPS